MESSGKLIDQNIFVYPTDTVWGIGAAFNDEKGIRRINEIKMIDFEKPQSLMFPSLDIMLGYLIEEEGVIYNPDFLSALFHHQVTLAYPLDAIDLRLAPSVVCQSKFICVRVLDKPWIREIYKKAGGPFTTTSLNLTGFPPITIMAEALDFKNTHCPYGKFYEGEEQNLSGTASSIIKIEGSKASFWRKGEDEKELQKLFKNFSLNCN